VCEYLFLNRVCKLCIVFADQCTTVDLLPKVIASGVYFLTSFPTYLSTLYMELLRVMNFSHPSYSKKTYTFSWNFLCKLSAIFINVVRVMCLKLKCKTGRILQP
jgi:hypothetical protein